MKMTDTTVRALRTLVQTFVGGVVSANVLSGISVTTLTHTSELEKVGLAAAVAGLSAVFSFVQNKLEDKGVISGLGK